MSNTQTRRGFLTTLSLAGAAGLLSPRCGWADEPALETTTVRFGKAPVIWFRPAIYLRGFAARRGVH